MYKKWISNIVQIEPLSGTAEDAVIEDAAGAHEGQGDFRFHLKALAVDPGPFGSPDPSREGDGDTRTFSTVGDILEYEWSAGVGATVM